MNMSIIHKLFLCNCSLPPDNVFDCMQKLHMQLKDMLTYCYEQATVTLYEKFYLNL